MAGGRRRSWARNRGTGWILDWWAHLDPLLTVLTIAIVFAPIELLRPARPRPGFSWARYRTDILHVVVGGFVIRIGVGLVVFWLMEFSGPIADATTLPIWAQVPLFLLLSDLCFYAAHRVYHAVPMLWEFHRIHHSSEHLDWLAAYRVHPVDQIINSTIIALPALYLGFSPLAVLIYGLVYRWHSILLHSNLRVSFGALGRIVTTPRFHHWHHANEPEAYDRNFGGQLVIWDKLFATAHEPDQERPGRYGVDDPPEESFLAHIITPFIASFRHGKPSQNRER